MIEFLVEYGVSPLWIFLVVMAAVQIVFFRDEYAKIYRFIFRKKMTEEAETQNRNTDTRLILVTDRIKSVVYTFLAILLFLLEIVVVLGAIGHQKVL